MNAGKLRHRLTLQRATVTRGATGQELKTWHDLATVWGEAQAQTMPEGTAEKQVTALSKYVVTIRYYPGLTALDRVLFDGRPLNIDSQPVDADGKKREMTFTAIEG